MAPEAVVTRADAGRQLWGGILASQQIKISYPEKLVIRYVSDVGCGSI
jgi:hypothetical protein